MTDKKFNTRLLKLIAPRGKMKIVQPLAPALNSLLPRYQINTPRRIAMFLANILVETGGFRALEENLNYSAERLMKVWPKRFPTRAKAMKYARNPEKLANYVYDRYGNVGHRGYGYKYRGRGFMQTTFVDNYRKVQRVTGLPVVDNPDLLAEVYNGLEAACIYWFESGCNELADAGKVKSVRKRINGGYHGLSMVQRNYKRVLPMVKDIDLSKADATAAGAGGVTTAAMATAATQADTNTALFWILAIGAVLAVGAIAGFIGWRRKRKKEANAEENLPEIEWGEDVPVERPDDLGGGDYMGDPDHASTPDSD